MLTLLSPAKKLDLEPVSPPLDTTQAALLSHTKILAQRAKKLSASDVKALMKLSDNLANLNYDRFQNFHLEGKSNQIKPAAYTFNGNVYEGFDAISLDATTLEYAQSHLRILSGLYGVLRPLDLIQPYRLEMGIKLDNPRGKNLYAFWQDHIGAALRETINGHADQTIVNLASNEYFKAVHIKTLNLSVVTPKFLNIKDGDAKNLMYYAKRARGLMARWVMDEKVETALDLQNFDRERYRFDATRSQGAELVFSRPQPAPKK